MHILIKFERIRFSFMNNNEELIKVNNLVIEFRDQEVPFRAVDNISFSIKRGEILGVVGESGSGKSMTALSIAGLLPRKQMHKSGEILFLGDELLGKHRKELRKYQGKSISMIFQEPMTALNPSMRIGYQVEEGLRIHFDMSKEEMKNKAIEWIDKVGINNPEIVYKSYPHELSGGMRQRIMIAAGMITSPELLIADEPTTALDVTTQKEIIDLLLELKKENNTAIMFISHDLSLIKKLCDRCIVMKNGKIVEEDDANVIFNHPKEEYTKQLISAIPTVV